MLIFHVQVSVRHVLVPYRAPLYYTVHVRGITRRMGSVS